MSFTLRTTSAGAVEIVTTFQSGEIQIPAFTDETHYHILGAFVPQVSARMRLEIMGLVSKSGVTLRAWFFDMITGELVSASLTTIAEAADTLRRGQAVELAAGKMYQIFVSAEAAAEGDDAFAIVRHATPVE